MKKVDEAIEALSAQFDTVQIFCTRHEGENTIAVRKGSGNWYARHGQVMEWLADKDEVVRASATKPDEQ